MVELVSRAAAVHYPPDDVRTESVHDIATLAELHSLLNRPAGLTMDCSQAVTLLCHLAGLADPNGLGYKRDGYTGTLLAHLPHYYAARNAGVGALVVYGPGTGHHVSMVHEPGSDPWLFSHGS